MEANELKIKTIYQYKCGEEPIKVMYIGKNLKHNNTYTFKAVEGIYRGFTETLSERSVENFITELEQ